MLYSCFYERTIDMNLKTTLSMLFMCSVLLIGCVDKEINKNEALDINDKEIKTDEVEVEDALEPFIIANVEMEVKKLKEKDGVVLVSLDLYNKGSKPFAVKPSYFELVVGEMDGKDIIQTPVSLDEVPFEDFSLKQHEKKKLTIAFHALKEQVEGLKVKIYDSEKNELNNVNFDLTAMK